MKNPTVKHFASELDMLPQVLLDLLKSARVVKQSFEDRVSDADKVRLHAYLLSKHTSTKAVSTRKLTPVRPCQHKLPLSFP